MEHYTDLVFRYIKMNKRRSIITALGVSVSVMVLYIILNLAWCYLLNYRAQIRSIHDYEIVLFTESKGQIDTILADSRVKDATVSSYYRYNYYEPQLYQNAMYINTTTPYRLNKIFEELCGDYGVEGIINTEIASTYLQGDEGTLVYIMILVALLISFIVAIFGVGLIRNAIQLTMLERIRDFGQLRCVGTTKWQLRWIIYLQGLVLELAGILLGTIMGVGGSTLAGIFLRWKDTGFHMLPVVFILVAFLGDWFFAMWENAKLVTEMTPVSAIRREYGIKKEKMKARKSRLFGKMFGTSGDYAYKSMMRNSGRFYRTVAVMTLGVAAPIVIFGVLSTMKRIDSENEENFGYYQMYYENPLLPWETKADIMKDLPPVDLMEEMGSLTGLEEMKKDYTGMALVVDWYEDIVAHYGEQALMFSLLHDWQSHLERLTDDEAKKDETRICISCIQTCGYDEDELARYKKYLIDGTLSKNGNGVMIVGGNEESYSMLDTDHSHPEIYPINNYKVGDQIRFVNQKHFRELMTEKMEPYRQEYEEKLHELREKRDMNGDNEQGDDEDVEAYTGKSGSPGDIGKTDGNSGEEAYDQSAAENALETKLIIKEIEVLCEVYQAVIDEGDYTTYTVEGIVDGDVNRGDRFYFNSMTGDYIGARLMNSGYPSMIMPKESYFELMGVDEDWISGMNYHFAGLIPSQYYNLDSAALEPSIDDFTYDFSWAYPGWIEERQSVNRILFAVGLATFFLVSMSVFNTINAAASNLHMRRRELAQLRVLGASKREVFKMVILEGVIESVLSCTLGVLFGVVIDVGVFYGIVANFERVKFAFPWIAAILSVVINIAVL